ncbi:MAG: hypothetical protein ACTHU0_00675 [Kofleriaceae bacterium]
MGWTFYYQLTRDRLLDTAERTALRAHVRTVKLSRRSEGYGFWIAEQANPRGQIAFGATKLASSDPAQAADLARLVAALTTLRRVIAGATVGVHDDLHTIAWDEAAGAYALVAGAEQDEVSWPHLEPPAWVPLSVPRKPRVRPAAATEPAEPAAPAAPAEVPSTDADVLTLLERLGKRAYVAADHALLAQVDANQVTRVALEHARVLDQSALHACAEAMAKATHVPDEARALGLAAWRDARDPRPFEWAFEQLARADAGIATALAAELAGLPVDGNLSERQWSALRMVARHPAARPHVIAALRRGRGTPPSDLTNRLIGQLAHDGAAEAAPTLFLHLDVGRCTDDVVRAAVRVDHTRRAELIRRLLVREQYHRPLAQAIAESSMPEALALLDELASHRDPGARLVAADALVIRRGRAAVPTLVAAVEYARRHGIWAHGRGPGTWFNDQVGRIEDVVARVHRRTEGLLERALGDAVAAWPAELAAQGLEVTDPGPPADRLARVLDGDPDIRRDALELWNEEALAAGDASQVRALVCAQRLHAERCRRAGLYQHIGSFTTRVRATHGWDAWRKRLRIPFDPMYRYDHVTWDWLVAHVDQVAPQDVPDALAAAATEAGARDLAATFPDVRFKLDADERASLEAEERSLFAAGS